MKKLTMEFDPFEDKHEIQRVLKATEAYIVLHEILESTLRQRIKYQELPEGQLELLEDIRDEIISYMEHYGVDLNDLE